MPQEGNKAMKADGWAIIECIGVDVRSVSPTRRAAIVNWLVTRGRWISTSTTDEQIEGYWSEDRGEAEAVPVSVQTVDEIDRLQAKILMAEGCSALATVGVDAHSAVVELSKETTGKLIAAEKEIAHLNAELRRLVPGYHD